MNHDTRACNLCTRPPQGFDFPALRLFHDTILKNPGERRVIQYRKKHRDGRWRWIEGSCMNLLDDPGVHALVGSFRDITERRLTEEELTSRVRQQAVVASFGQRALSGVTATELMDEAARLITWVLDIQFCKVLQLLPDGKTMLIRSGIGWRPGVVGSALLEVGPGSQAGYALMASEPVVVENLNTEARFSETPLLQSHGIVSGMSVIIHGTDRPFGILGAHSSVERRFTPDDVHFLQSMANILGEAMVRSETEEALHASEKHYRALIENSFDATALVAPDGIILYASPSTTRVLGYDVEEFVGMNMFDLIHPDDLEPMAQLYIDILSNSGSTASMNYRSNHKDGSWRWIEGNVTNFVADDGRHAVIANYRDVTERQEWENQLQAAKDAAEGANNAKDQFLAVLSHELRTPLTPVLASVEAIGIEASLPEELRNYVEIIRRNVELEARLIDDLLDLTRISKGKLQLSRELVDLHSIVHHVEEICRHDIAAKHLAVRFELDAADHYVHGDPARLQQVLWNLVQNAVKFTPEDGTIIVRTSNPNRRTVRVEVIDTGIGIDEQIMSRIFNAFEQGERTITRRFGGLGLGLAISKMLVNAHGGTLEATSEGHDRGSTFTVELACAEPVFAAREPKEETRSEMGKRITHILLVDDHHDTRLVMKILLERHGYRVSTADSVASARAFAGREHFDLLVSDIGLPDGSGLDLMRELRKLRDIKGIALSGFGMEDDLKRSRDAGFGEHLIKPVSFQRLVEVVEEVLSS